MFLFSYHVALGIVARPEVHAVDHPADAVHSETLRQEFGVELGGAGLLDVRPDEK